MTMAQLLEENQINKFEFIKKTFKSFKFLIVPHYAQYRNKV